MKTTKILWFFELLVIALIPISTLFFVYFENSDFYKSWTKFEYLEKAILYRFSSNTERIVDSTEVKNILNKELEPDEFNTVWNIIKKHSMLKEVSSFEPHLISTLASQGVPYVDYNGDRLFLIPDSVPIVISSCYEYQVATGTCKGVENGMIVGTLEDFKNWYDDEKRQIRDFINLILGLIAIIIAVILWNIERKKFSIVE